MSLRAVSFQYDFPSLHKFFLEMIVEELEGVQEELIDLVVLVFLPSAFLMSQTQVMLTNYFAVVD